MKKFISVIMIIAVCLCCFSSCGSGINKIKGDADVISMFRSYGTPKQIMKRISNISLDYARDTDGLTSKKEVDTKYNSTVQYWYDKENNPVYKVYIGNDSENGFEYYTQDKDGNDVTVGYYNKTQNKILLTSDNYSVTYSALTDDSKYGATKVEITVKSDDGFEYLTYQYLEADSVWVAMNGSYYLKGSYQYYWYDTIDSTPYSYERLEPTEEVTASDSAKFTGDAEHVVLFYAGSQQMSYTEDGDEHKWYITCDFVILTPDEASAKEYADTYGIAYSNVDGNILNVGSATIPLSSDCQNGEQYVVAESDTPGYYGVIFNDNGEITNFDVGITLSYYN